MKVMNNGLSHIFGVGCPICGTHNMANETTGCWMDCKGCGCDLYGIFYKKVPKGFEDAEAKIFRIPLINKIVVLNPRKAGLQRLIWRK